MLEFGLGFLAFIVLGLFFVPVIPNPFEYFDDSVPKELVTKICLGGILASIFYLCILITIPFLLLYGTGWIILDLYN